MAKSRKRTLADWKDAARAEMKGASAGERVWVSPEGIPVKTLYTAEDLEKL